MSASPAAVPAASAVDSPPDGGSAELDPPERPTPVEMVDALERHPQGEALAAYVRAAALEAAAARRLDFASRFHTPSQHPPPKLPHALSRADADTAYGNVGEALDRRARAPLEAERIGASPALSPPRDADPRTDEPACAGHR